MKRDARIDNLRAFLMFLVVLGHLYETVSFPSSEVQYTLIYAFHMPAFVFLSGVCWKYNGQEDRRALKNLLYPYVVFQVLWHLFQVWVLKKNPQFQLTSPIWIQWYFLSMFFWYGAATLLGRLRPWAELTVLALSLVLAVNVGFDKNVGYLYSASRTLVLFPFFYLGVIYARRETLRRFVRSVPAKVLGLVCLAAAGVWYGRRMSAIDHRWLYHSYAYEALRNPYTWTFRLISLGLAAGVILCLMAWFPGRKLKLVTRIGQNTLPVYALHGFAVRLLSLKLNWKQYFVQRPMLALPACLGVALILLLVLSSPPVAWLTRPLTRWPFGGRKPKQDAV